MYAWIWHRLPGRTPVRAGVLTLLILAVAAVLWFYVFPWAALHLPIGVGDRAILLRPSGGR